MKKWFLLIAVFALVFSACDTSHNPITEDPATEDPATEGTATENPSDEIPYGTLVAPTDEELASDTRLSSFDADGVWWLRKPVKKTTSMRSVVYNIPDGDPIAAYCTEPGWAYIFYDDQAVIGYEPFPDRVDVMQRAVIATVEVHNRDNPLEEWGFINVPMPYTPPDTSNDPVLGKWQYALCLDDGTIVDGTYTAEFDWEWAMWKERVAAAQRDSYNLEHDPDAHIVWGTDE
jgi:hypothetical protein